ncbi:uncharacterized protein LOC113850921 [Abrus precatorius]|uniref:Uncharacterized protein LOC113850921 n=1 Tax=Abrus precatorius TaxID=3816 RepID=A0A8B8K1B6_ABRPR|nr:uncharacterized protein LOC113850921 [Abrus precatorius]
MAGNDNIEKRTLNDYARARPRENPTSIVKPPIQANNFEIRLDLMRVVQQEQFVGHPSEDPHTHIQNFLAICNMVRMNGVSDETFDDGLNVATKTMVDAVVGGSLSLKTPAEARELIEVMASNNYNHRDKSTMKRGVLELNTLDALLA